MKEEIKDAVNCCTPSCCGGDSKTMNTDSETLKKIVQEKYSEIALKAAESYDSIEEKKKATSCCGAMDYSVFADDYSHLEGYNESADLGLGCGLPTEFAQIKKGDVVVDLGAGAGNDAFVARSETGETGKVIGVDFTEAMILPVSYTHLTLPTICSV